MKNKSKLNKMKQGSKKSAAYPKEWLYLSERTVTPRQIAALFDGEESDGAKRAGQGSEDAGSAGSTKLQAQLWEAAGVVEIELPDEAKSIDFEQTSTDFGDEYSNEYLRVHGIQSAYLVTIVPDDYDQAVVAMRRIIASLGGFFCGDTADFTPVVKG